MTDPTPPLTTFDDLRKVGIDYAQDASRGVWTDYNLHDPGVTLLEQTCFALSQLAYQTAHPTRDLLTTPKGNFPFRDMGLQAPRKVLCTAPVTRADLAQWLSLCPTVERVLLNARGPQAPGLYDAVVFANSDDNDALIADIRAAFARVRPLGSALGEVEIAPTVKVILSGTVEVASDIVPETIAAELYLAIRGYLAGHPASATPPKSAARADVYIAPERLLSSPRARGIPGFNLESAYGVLRDLPGVQEIEALSLLHLSPFGPMPSGPVHLHLILPTTPDHVKLKLRLHGTKLTLDPGRLREEFIRLQAERVALAKHHIDVPDWDVLRPGRPRRFALGHVDGLLPMIYRAQKGANRAQLDTYRSAINAVLQDMGAALQTAPQTFCAGHAADFSDAAVHRRRLALLDYLIALQGFEMPSTDHTGLHFYRGVAERHRFALDWRLRTLYALPTLQASRGTGPGPEGQGGFLEMIALLCDLDIEGPDAPAPSLAAYGLHLRADASLAPRPESNRVTRIKTVNPLDTLPIEQPDAALLTPADLRRCSPFLQDGALPVDVFARMIAVDAIWTTPGAGGAWQVVVDLGTGDKSDPWEVARFTPDAPGGLHPRDAAFAEAARLRATWRHLHRGMEQIRLIEPILTGKSGPRAAQTAQLVLPGWTARTKLDSFRAYVTAQVAMCAPMYVHVTLHWLDFPEAETAPVALPEREAAS